jgi:hypothetical protein
VVGEKPNVKAIAMAVAALGALLIVLGGGKKSSTAR